MRINDSTPKTARALEAKKSPATTKLQGCIDRFEGKYAVIDFGDAKPPMNILKSKLPKAAKEGQWLDLEMKGDKLVKAKVNQGKTDSMKKEIEDLMKDLFVD
ncbi:MAG TPA: DUF3006 domain-containing protein [Myxococcales bacterium]|jgi:hypothetical protein